MALQEECGLGSTVSPRGIQGTPQSCAAPSFCTMWGLASAERVSRNQPAEVMQVQTGPEGGNSLDELRVMSEWDAEPFSQNQEKSYNLQKGRTDHSPSGRSSGS